MNHINRGHYLSLKPQKKRYTQRVHGSPYINSVKIIIYKFLSVNNCVTMIKVLITCLACIKAL